MRDCTTILSLSLIQDVRISFESQADCMAWIRSVLLQAGTHANAKSTLKVVSQRAALAWLAVER